MQPIQLFELASRQAQWLSVRQTVVSSNIANANTPGFRANDVSPFQAVLDQTDLPMARTNPAHFSGSVNEEMGVRVRQDETADTLVSGNSVDLADQLMKQGQIRREYEINTGVVKAFNKMILMTVRR